MKKDSMTGRVAPPPPPFSAVAASLFVNVLTLALPLVMLQIFDRVIPYAAGDTLFLLSLGLIAATGLDFMLKSARAVLMGASAEAYERRLLDMATRRALAADPDAFDEEPAPARFERFAAAAQLREFAGGEGRLLALDLAFIAVFAGLIWHIGGWLVAVPLTALALIFGASLIFRRAQFALFDQRRSVDARRFAFLGEFLERMATVKAHRMEAPLQRRYEILQDQAAVASRRLVFTANLSQSFGAVFGQAATAAMALFGAILVIEGRLGIAELAACTLLNGRAVQPMTKLIGVWSQAEGVSAARRKFAALTALPERLAAPAARTLSLEGAVEARGLARVNPGRGDPLFQPLTFVAPPGRRLVITGGDGTGKTTLLRLFLGELQPSAGEALIDGRPAAFWLSRRGRDGIAYVDQQPVVFHGSIIENIAPSGRPEDVEDGFAAASALGLDEEIRRLPHGYETPLGQTGGTASFNFLQRIALARALALRPKILLFNEANTAMDRPSDEKALAALAALEGRTTLILVSRRPAWIALGDEVITLAPPMDRPAAETGAGAEAPLILTFAQMRAPGGPAAPYRLSFAEMVAPGPPAPRPSPRRTGRARRAVEAAR